MGVRVDGETIVAIATAPGRGGIGVVRLSGERAREIAAPMLRLKGAMEAGRAQFGYLLEDSGNDGCRPDGAVLDEVVMTYFAGPRSYTGEDVVEVAAHGSPVVLEAIVRGCLARGARLAEPGEFTQRAFLSGRLDLVQAEAVNDLIRSTTLHQVRTAASQMGGAVSREVQPAKMRLVTLIATMEAGIDFAEDDIDVLPGPVIAGSIEEVREPLVALERSYAYGRVVRDGFRLAIAGRPNAGKSSLFNALIERERAIVTAAPGTTRDTVTETVSMNGVPVELVDTAGLRADGDDEQVDEAEVLGIARSRQAMADADVVLLVVDGTVALHAEDMAILESADGAGRLVVVRNKSDLYGPGDVDGEARASTEGAPDAAELGAVTRRNRLEVVETSTRTGAGMPKLRAAIRAAVGGDGATRDGGLLTNLRQHQAILGALLALEEGRAAVEAGLPHEVVLLDLRRALDGLDALTGTTTSEDILRLIFSSFCIGK